MEYQRIELSEVILDIAAGPFGSNLKKECFQESGFPIVDGANLKGFKLTDNLTKFVTEEKARSLYRSIAKRNDVVVTISGTLGQIAYIPEDSEYEEYLCSQRQFRVTFDTSKIYVPYLVFYFHTYEGQNKILCFANQTGVPALAQPLKNFRQIQVDIPPLEEQKKIAGIVETINNKIETNNKINRNLSEQAQAMVHEWEETEKDNIEYKTVADVAELNPDTYSPKEEWDFVNYLDTSSITERTISELTYIIPSTEKLPSRARRKLIADDIVYSTVRPNQKHYGYINQPEQNMLASTGFVVVRANKKLVSSQLLYLLITRDIVTEKMQQIAEGSTSTFPSIKPSDLGTYEIPVPKAGFRTNLIDGLDYIFKCMYSNQQENRRLADLRDCLLPKLMSGKLDVSDLEI